VFEATQDAIVVTDRDARIVATNPAFTQISGYTAQEVLGQSVACCTRAIRMQLLRHHGAVGAQNRPLVGRDPGAPQEWRHLSRPAERFRGAMNRAT
jgi:PAS domain-containing protein